MLRRCQRVAEPGNIGKIDQQIGFRQGADDFLAERVLVADIRGNLQVADTQRRLLHDTGGEIRHRDLRQAHEPAEPGRNELAEGNEVALVIALCAGRANGEGRVGIDRGVAGGNPENQFAVFTQCQRAKFIEIAGGQLVQERRDGRFRQHSQLCRVVAGEPVINAQRIGEAFRLPLDFLGDVALQQGNADRLPVGLRP